MKLTVYDYKNQKWLEGNAARPLLISQATDMLTCASRLNLSSAEVCALVAVIQKLKKKIKLNITILEGNFEDQEYMRAWVKFLEEKGHNVKTIANTSGVTPAPTIVNIDDYEGFYEPDFAYEELDVLQHQFEKLY